MGTGIICWKADNYPVLLFDDGSEWPDRWLGRKVTFRLCGVLFEGEVIECERVHQADGTHDIVTVEIDNEAKQVKVLLHRQACKRV